MRRGAERVRQCCSLRNLSHILLFASSQTALAHEADAARATFLHLVSWPLFPLLLVFVLYSLGLRQLWRGGGGRGVSCIQAGSFIAGGALVLITWSGPLNRGAASSLAAHVAQHMVLMGAVPPLLLLGRPGVVTLGLLPTRTARALTAPLRKARRLQFWALLASPVTAMLVQSAVMWSWHLPAAMDLAIQNAGWHGVMHASFLATGLWFWAALLRSIRNPDAGAGSGALAIVGSMMAMGLLGALLTFADRPRYPVYAELAAQLGRSALGDQQLAGLIMWVPSALPYLIGGLIITALWLRRDRGC